MSKAMTTRTPTADEIREFFAWSDRLDHDVLRPLSHIRSNWEALWNHVEQRYEPEDDSFAEDLNVLIDDLATTAPPKRYHDNEDVLANYVIETLKWPIRKEKGRWVGADYYSILEHGGFQDVDQAELLAAASGRIHAAIRSGQTHFDQMEESHQKMLCAVLTIVLYHRDA
jgi:hypothetical protein